MKRILEVSLGVFIGNIITASLVISLLPYIKVERSIATIFFKR